jgi:hypothetical protein
MSKRGHLKDLCREKDDMEIGTEEKERERKRETESM